MKLPVLRKRQKGDGTAGGSTDVLPASQATEGREEEEDLDEAEVGNETDEATEGLVATSAASLGTLPETVGAN